MYFVPWLICAWTGLSIAFPSSFPFLFFFCGGKPKPPFNRSALLSITPYLRGGIASKMAALGRRIYITQGLGSSFAYLRNLSIDLTSALNITYNKIIHFKRLRNSTQSQKDIAFPVLEKELSNANYSFVLFSRRGLRIPNSLASPLHYFFESTSQFNRYVLVENQSRAFSSMSPFLDKKYPQEVQLHQPLPQHQSRTLLYGCIPSLIIGANET